MQADASTHTAALAAEVEQVFLSFLRTADMQLAGLSDSSTGRRAVVACLLSMQGSLSVICSVGADVIPGALFQSYRSLLSAVGYSPGSGPSELVFEGLATFSPFTPWSMEESDEGQAVLDLVTGISDEDAAALDGVFKAF